MIHKVVRYAQGIDEYIPTEKGGYPVNEENIWHIIKVIKISFA